MTRVFRVLRAAYARNPFEGQPRGCTGARRSARHFETEPLLPSAAKNAAVANVKLPRGLAVENLRVKVETASIKEPFEGH